MEKIHYYHACAKRNTKVNFYKWKNDPKWSNGNVRTLKLVIRNINDET